MNNPNFLPRLDKALATWPHWQVRLSAAPIIEGELHGGLSNRSWLVNTGAGRAVVRLNSTRDGVFNIDRERERTVLNTLAGRDFIPDIWFCDPAQGVLVSGFVEGEIVGDQAQRQPRIQEQMGELLARIQGTALDLPKFDYWQHLTHYRRQVLRLELPVPAPLVELFAQYGEALRRFQDAHWQPVLVHHDLTPANLIATERGLVLLDWEYAARGYGGMDTLAWFSGDDPFAIEVDVYRQLINGYWQLLAGAG